MIAVRDHLDQFGHALPVVITFTDDPHRLAAYREHLGIEFPVLAPDGRLRRLWLPASPDARPAIEAIIAATR